MVLVSKEVIVRQDALLDPHAHFTAGLADDFTQAHPHIAVQNLEPILRNPNDMISVKKLV